MLTPVSTPVVLNRVRRGLRGEKRKADLDNSDSVIFAMIIPDMFGWGVSGYFALQRSTVSGMLNQ